MSLQFTSDARPPSNVTLLPNSLIRPAFGELYGFDADADTGGNGGAGFRIDVLDTHANILARTGDADGTIAYGTDTNDLYIYEGSVWIIYINNFTV